MEPIVLFAFALVGMLGLVRMIGGRPLVVCQELVRTRWFWISLVCGVVAVLLTAAVDLATATPLVTTRLIAAGLLSPFLGWTLLVVLLVARTKARP